MAFDTVIDKAQLEAAMKATADAIRGKTGDTADCTWDPSQGFAALIAAIESGARNVKVKRMTFTPSEDVELIEIEHNLGTLPNAVVWFTEATTAVISVAYANLFGAVIHSEKTSGVCGRVNTTGNANRCAISNVSGIVGNTEYSMYGGSLSVARHTSDTSVKVYASGGVFASGFLYHLFVIADESLIVDSGGSEGGATPV